MANLIVPVGIPGSGKSTWARTILGHGKYAIVSSDDIRIQLWGSLRVAHDVTPEQKKENNAKVWGIFYRKIEENLQHSVDTYADGTNLRDHAREKLRAIANRTNSSIHVIVFTNTTQAFGRNIKREKDKYVPQSVMNDFLAQFNEQRPLVSKEPWDSYTEIGLLD